VYVMAPPFGFLRWPVPLVTRSATSVDGARMEVPGNWGELGVFARTQHDADGDPSDREQKRLLSDW